MELLILLQSKVPRYFAVAQALVKGNWLCAMAKSGLMRECASSLHIQRYTLLCDVERGMHADVISLMGATHVESCFWNVNLP